METIILDGALLAERESAMDALSRALALPDWWGRNLDALYDCLTDCETPRRLVLRNRAALEASPFGRRLLRVLTDAARNAPSHLELVPEA
ncbi:barstar family protein [Dysosmobacter sp.]|uniref:barstar family protein n=1 Tax=Dysosmobacter sp. TaxID=2591382 RepID=UPI002A8A8E0D|nr:barstar family protein [Dysosmobacter sp.]MDY3985254.1 barstar family protein [Dysosmobacter sp.]